MNNTTDPQAAEYWCFRKCQLSSFFILLLKPKYKGSIDGNSLSVNTKTAWRAESQLDHVSVHSWIVQVWITLFDFMFGEVTEKKTNFSGLRPWRRFSLSGFWLVRGPHKSDVLVYRPALRSLQVLVTPECYKAEMSWSRHFAVPWFPSCWLSRY